MPSPAASSPRRVAVVGAGAVGAVFGLRLARAGADVTFLARGATLAALRERGLVIDSWMGDDSLPPGHAAGSAGEIGPVDVVLVATKAGQVEAIAPTLAPLVGADTVVVPMQNGVESSGRLAAALGEDHVAEGLCRVIAAQTEPGRVHHMAQVPTIEFGTRPSDALTPGARAHLTWLADAFRSTGVHVETPADAAVAVWEKFMFIEPLGVVGGASRVPFAEMRGTPETRAALDACGREVLALARAHGVAVTEASLAGVWERWNAQPADGTASMQRDLMAGRPSELDSQTGAVVRLGRARGVPVPVHETLYAVLLPQELRARR